MRRAILCLVLGGCFEDPDDHVSTIGATTAGSTATSSEESSSSDAGSSSSEGVEESSSTGPMGWDPHVCPDWCSGCETVAGIYQLCRCTSDFECEDGTHCDRPTEAPGHCIE